MSQLIESIAAESTFETAEDEARAMDEACEYFEELDRRREDDEAAYQLEQRRTR